MFNTNISLKGFFCKNVTSYCKADFSSEITDSRIKNIDLKKEFKDQYIIVKWKMFCTCIEINMSVLLILCQCVYNFIHLFLHL